jgi:hypothetical protein
MIVKIGCRIRGKKPPASVPAAADFYFRMALQVVCQARSHDLPLGDKAGAGRQKLLNLSLQQGIMSTTQHNSVNVFLLRQ